MIANINERPQAGATCMNCHNELRAMLVQTNQGNQAMYVCENDNCKNRYNLTVAYRPPAVTEATPAKKESK